MGSTVSMHKHCAKQMFGAAAARVRIDVFASNASLVTTPWAGHKTYPAPARWPDRPPVS